LHCDKTTRYTSLRRTKINTGIQKCSD